MAEPARLRAGALAMGLLSWLFGSNEHGRSLRKAGYGLKDRFHAKVVGVTFDNDDRSSRQRIISQLRVGQELRLVRRHDIPEYPYALEVWARQGQIGHISEDYNREWARNIEGGDLYVLTISSLTSGGRKKTRGVNIQVEHYRRP